MKPIYRSRTFWFGLAVALLPFLEAVPALLAALDVEWPTVVSVIGAVVVALRWATTQPVTLTPPPDEP